MLPSSMPRKPKYSNHQAAIRVNLSELGHTVVLKDEPIPSVFLDHEPAARFYGPDWFTVYTAVREYIFSTMKPKTLS